MEDLPIFQERLLLARRRAGVSQGELAKRTQTTLFRVPQETTLTLIAAYAARWHAAQPLSDATSMNEGA